jgi:hypothetical protein
MRILDGRRYHSFCIALLGSLSLALSACSSSTGHVGSATTVATLRPLSSLVAPTPSGFAAEAIDEDSGGKTGSVAIAEASSADCDGVGQQVLQQDHWVASELRYFNDDPAYPMTALLLCLTQLGSFSAASQDRQSLAASLDHALGSVSAPVMFSVSGIPNSSGYYVAGDHGIVNIIFAEGKYFVFVSAAGLSASGAADAQALATNLATTQYQRLAG